MSADDPSCAPGAEYETQPAPLPQAGHSFQHLKDSRTTCASLHRPIAARAKPRAQPRAHPPHYLATTARCMARHLRMGSPSGEDGVVEPFPPEVGDVLHERHDQRMRVVLA